MRARRKRSVVFVRTYLRAKWPFHEQIAMAICISAEGFMKLLLWSCTHFLKTLKVCSLRLTSQICACIVVNTASAGYLSFATLRLFVAPLKMICFGYQLGNNALEVSCLPLPADILLIVSIFHCRMVKMLVENTPERVSMQII